MYIFLNKMKNRNLKNGFTIIELIIAGAISLTAIGVGFSVLQIALKGNKLEIGSNVGKNL